MMYASRATENFDSIQIGTIVTTAQKNNPSLGLTGALFMSDSCFFQCLEGSRESVNTLLRALYKDNRHKDLEILELKEVEQRLFQGWNMKLVTSSNVKKEIYKQTGSQKFNPYKLDSQGCEKLLAVFLQNKPPVDTREDAAEDASVQSTPSKFFLWRLFGY
jgi:predicted sulfurtransferase